MVEIPRAKSTSHLPPRKVVVGTSHQAFRPPYPGLQNRLDHLSDLIDRMAATAPRRLDLAVLPEMAVTGGLGGWHGAALERALPFEGEVQDTFAKKAREHHCYIVVPMNLRENDSARPVSNAAILLDRRGEVAGIYRKIHLAVLKDSDELEAGTSPGKSVPVFDCDFGRLGFQICFDVMFDYGWQELARQNADLVVWPTMRPGSAHAMARALWHRYYIVSSTWGHTAHIVEPSGKVIAQANADDPVVVKEIDLSYAILVPWAGRPGENGAGLTERFGDKLGFRCYEDEGMGIFWSNDPHKTIAQMAREAGACELESELARTRPLYCAAGIPGIPDVEAK